MSIDKKQNVPEPANEFNETEFYMSIAELIKQAQRSLEKSVNTTSIRD